MEREAGVWQDFIFPSVLVRIWEMEYGEKGTRKHRQAGGRAGAGGASGVGEVPPIPLGRSGSELQAAKVSLGLG